ncbi:PadR family transcriptional regulator [Gryllotalpicola reticulitermitis]|uniref:PadR family transcriptional regulator n=1 Tax=Gryllotalpicola reticulitermitis TaxID=1184153 RepID=A0ABV8Q3W4_9MICO
MTQTEMREPTMLVLASLAGGRKHGYALIADATDLSAGRVKLKAGTLYAVLDRLVEQRLVQIAGDEVVDGRNRRYFEITAQGIDALEGEARRLEANAAAARARIAGWRPAGTGQLQFGWIS